MSSIRNAFDAFQYDVLIAEPVTPGAGNPAVIAAPENSRSAIHTIAFRLQTDGNSADRQLIVERAETPVNQIIAGSQSLQTASKTQFYIGHPGGTTHVTTDPLVHTFSLPTAFMFFEGDAVRFNILNMQAGDVITQIVLTWLTQMYQQ